MFIKVFYLIKVLYIFRIAYCQEKGCNPKDPFDLLLDDVKSKIDGISTEWWEKTQDAIFDDQIKETFNLINSILERVKQFDLPETDYKIPRLVLLALLKKVQEFEQNEAIDHPYKMNRIEFEDCKTIGQYALNVYAASWSWMRDPQDAALKMGLDDKDEILFTWFQDQDGDDHCPKFMIFTDHDSKSIILAIRGTYSLADVIVDIICDEEEFLDGHAHRGILKGAKRILKESGDILKKAIQDFPDHRLVITGHSLGAGTAVLITMALMNSDYPEIFNPDSTPIKCVALAAPPVYRSRLPCKADKHISIFINENDIVPRLSLANMATVITKLRAIDNVAISVQDHLKILAGFEDSDVTENLKILSNAISGVHQTQFPSLDHHGDIYFFHKNNNEEKSFDIYRKPGQYFSGSLLLLENMILDHLQPYYEEAFANVKSLQD